MRRESTMNEEEPSKETTEMTAEVRKLPDLPCSGNSTAIWRQTSALFSWMDRKYSQESILSGLWVIDNKNCPSGWN